METHQELTAYEQYLYKQDGNACWQDSASVDIKPLKQNSQLLHSKSVYIDESENVFFYPKITVDVPDEPIDLSTIANKNQADELIFTKSIPPVQPLTRVDYSTAKPYNYFPQRYKKHKVVCTEDNKILLVNAENKQPTHVSFSSDKQLEVLKAAKSLFSKRTRTLYHWMYPNISKQQIKHAVTTSWESLNKHEKDFYISQVLGRFGFSHSNLMVNPQIDSLKELPSVSPPVVLNRKNADRNRELQTATSSLSNGQSAPVTFEEYEAYSKRYKKRRGRASGQRKKVDVMQFKDDPELSLELEKFALKFNLKKPY